jgi:hypothetical protein
VLARIGSSGTDGTIRVVVVSAPHSIGSGLVGASRPLHISNVVGSRGAFCHDDVPGTPSVSDDDPKSGAVLESG